MNFLKHQDEMCKKITNAINGNIAKSNKIPNENENRFIQNTKEFTRNNDRKQDNETER